MDVTIGTFHTAREITLTVDLTEDELKEKIQHAIAVTQLLELEDSKGQKAIIPASAIAYVLIGSSAPAPVGFRI